MASDGTVIGHNKVRHRWSAIKLQNKTRGNNKIHPDDSKNGINLKESLFQNKRVTCQMALFTNFFTHDKFV